MKNEILEYSSVILGEKYYKIKHVSGLDVYVYPKKMATSYALFATKYGAFDISFTDVSSKKNTALATPAGIAHYLEHKLFANPDGVDSFERFSDLGADANAYTAYDKTVYLFSCTENFGDSLRELVNFVTHPYFTKENVDRERGIISQEIKMNDDNPYSRCALNLYRTMYENHPIRNDIGGTLKTISKITPELLYECYNTFYNPSNMALVVCGDHTPEEVMGIIDGILPQSCEPHMVVRRTYCEKPSVLCGRTEQKMNIGKTVFTIGIKDTDIPDDPLLRLKKETAVTVLDEILFSKAGSFFSDNFESGLLGPSFSCDYSMCRDVAFNMMFGESDKPDEVLERMFEYADFMRKHGIPKEDFERSKRVLYAGFLREFDSTEDIANNMVDFLFDGVNMFDYPDIINSITYDDVSELLRISFERDRTALSVVSPIESARLA